MTLNGKFQGDRAKVAGIPGESPGGEKKANFKKNNILNIGGMIGFW